MEVVSVSVIISVYNLESYVSNCLDSIINQTFQDLEVIVVDDGSTDKSLQIIKDYAQKDNRIKVFSKPNSGANSARNLGLDKAIGEYVTFVDGDDMLAPYALELFYTKAKELNLDSVVGNQFKVKSKNEISYALDKKNEEIDAKYLKPFSWKDLSKKDFWYQTWFMTVHGRLDKRSLYEGIRFNEKIHMGEDQITIKEILLRTQKVMLVDAFTYFYMYRPNSLTHKRHKKAFDIFKSYSVMENLLSKYGLKDEFYTSFIEYYFDCIWAHLIIFLPLQYYPMFLLKFYNFNKNILIKKIDSQNIDAGIYKMMRKYRSLFYFLIKAPKKALREYKRINKNAKKNSSAIKTSDISVVVQGAIDKENTPKCLKSIRKHLKGATIILSTWEGADVSNLDYDVLIFNKDPGGFKDSFLPTFTNNTLRQLISTQSGLKKVETDYVMKIRSDLILESAEFLKYFNAYPKKDPQYSLYKNKIIACSFFSKKYLAFDNNFHPVPFHISDWILFGSIDDLNKFYDIDLPKEPEFSEYFAINKISSKKVNLLGCSHRYAPEQYIAYSAFKKQYPDVIQFEHYMDYDKHNILISEKFVASNFIILSPTQFKFYCGKASTGTDYYKKWSKHPTFIPYLLWLGLYRFDVYLEDYKKYCDPDYKIPLLLQLRTTLEKILKGIVK